MLLGADSSGVSRLRQSRCRGARGPGPVFAKGRFTALLRLAAAGARVAADLVTASDDPRKRRPRCHRRLQPLSKRACAERTPCSSRSSPAGVRSAGAEMIAIEARSRSALGGPTEAGVPGCMKQGSGGVWGSNRGGRRCRERRAAYQAEHRGASSRRCHPVRAGGSVLSPVRRASRRRDSPDLAVVVAWRGVCCDVVMPGRSATSWLCRRRGRGAGRRGRGLSAPWRVAGCRASVRRS
jgi:hypothetical protein